MQAFALLDVGEVGDARDEDLANVKALADEEGGGITVKSDIALRESVFDGPILNQQWADVEVVGARDVEAYSRQS